MELSGLMRKIGWMSFAAMWVPFIGIFVGMIGLPEGSYAWSELPLITRVSLMSVGVLFGASMGLLFGAPIVSALQNRAVRRSGRLAQAEVIQIWDTGTTINQNPVVRLRLEVRPEGEPPFQAEAEQLISRVKIPQLQPGAIVQVKYDPADDDVALVGL